MSDAMTWRRHPLPALGLSVEVVGEWPVETWERADGGGLFQRSPGGGGVFVNWGAGASAEELRASFGDALTQVVEVRESATTVLGTAALRIEAETERAEATAYRRDESGIVVHADTPAARLRTTALAFSRRGLPVLVGYRLPEASIRRYRRVLERFLESPREIDP